MKEIPERSEILKFSLGEIIAERYKILFTSDNKPDILGEGGSGVVYLSEQELYKGIQIKRAIKFFVMRKDIAELTAHHSSAPISVSNFEDEIVNISSVNHEHIVKVIEAGIWKSPTEHKVPFLVTEYISGPTLENVITKGEKAASEKKKAVSKKYFEVLKENPTLLVDLILQACNGISYLHSRDFFHCDVAPKNIFIDDSQGELRLIIGDLGIGKTLKEPIRQKDKRTFFVACTPNYSPEVVLSVKNQEITYKEFRNLQPWWDIYALLKTSMALLNVLKKEISSVPSWMKALENLLIQGIKEKRFVEVKLLKEWIQWLHPTQRMIGGIQELGASFSGMQKKLMPIESVTTSERIRYLINHPSLQRLKHVPQLVMSSAIFPGSNHTRFEHTLGTYEGMRRYLLAFLDEPEFLAAFSPEYFELAIVSALLYNITRFPFSTIVHEIHSSNKELLEKFTRSELLDELLNSPHTKQEESLKDLLIKYFPRVDINKLLDILINKPKPGDTGSHLVHFLLKSSIDVRVIDYLQRDSHHLGYSKGITFDFNELLQSIRFRNGEILVLPRGVPAVEKLVTLRYWLFNGIYWNSPNRRLIAMIKYVIIRLLEPGNGFEKALRDKVLSLSEKDMLQLFRNWADKYSQKDVVEICDYLISDYPKLFKEFYQVNRVDDNAREAPICDKMASLNVKQFYKLQKQINQIFIKYFNLSKDHLHILLDIPPISIAMKLGDDLNVLTYDDSIVPMTRYSGVISGVHKGFLDHIQRFRVFVNPYLFEQANISKKEVVKKIEDILEATI